MTEVTVETESGASFQFPCNAWINNQDGNDVNGRTFSCGASSGRAVSLNSLTPVKYEVVVVTADEKGILVALSCCFRRSYFSAI